MIINLLLNFVVSVSTDARNHKVNFAAQRRNLLGFPFSTRIATINIEKRNQSNLRNNLSVEGRRTDDILESIVKILQEGSEYQLLNDEKISDGGERPAFLLTNPNTL